jgi:hypothetical protein
MANYFGNQGSRVILIKENGGTTSYDIPSPQEMTENPWKIVQQQDRDINNILRVDELLFLYQNTMSWTNLTTTQFQNLLAILNFKTNDTKKIRFFPHKDMLENHFNIVITQGSPGLFSKVPYDAFTLTFTSEDYLNKIVDPQLVGTSQQIDIGGTYYGVGEDLEID